jgi:hypothetical protein
MPRKRNSPDAASTDESLTRYRRATGLKKLRSRLDQAMEEALRLRERNDISTELVEQLRAVWWSVHQLELKARGKK